MQILTYSPNNFPLQILVGPVAHADVLLGRDGRSKGCGVVEYQNADDARAAIRKLNDVVLMGRPVFVREDRESESRIGFSGGRGGASAAPAAGAGATRRDVNTRQIYVANVSVSFLLPNLHRPRS